MARKLIRWSFVNGASIAGCFASAMSRGETGAWFRLECVPQDDGYVGPRSFQVAVRANVALIGPGDRSPGEWEIRLAVRSVEVCMHGERAYAPMPGDVLSGWYSDDRQGEVSLAQKILERERIEDLTRRILKEHMRINGQEEPRVIDDLGFCHLVGVLSNAQAAATYDGHGNRVMRLSPFVRDLVEGRRDEVVLWTTDDVVFRASSWTRLAEKPKS